MRRSSVCIDVIAVPEPKTVKNCVHIDLATMSAAHQAEMVARLRDLGATPAGIGQGDVSWTVLADPEGNEFCVLAPWPGGRDTGPVAEPLHLDFRPYPGDDRDAEVVRLRALGATDLDFGQGDVPWTCLADPEGNEFDVLTPR